MIENNLALKMSRDVESRLFSYTDKHMSYCILNKYIVYKI